VIFSWIVRLWDTAALIIAARRLGRKRTRGAEAIAVIPLVDSPPSRQNRGLSAPSRERQTASPPQKLPFRAKIMPLRVNNQYGLLC
jgi:hypothetical protein